MRTFQGHILVMFSIVLDYIQRALKIQLGLRDISTVSSLWNHILAILIRLGFFSLALLPAGFEPGPLRGPLEDPRFKIIGALEKLENYLKYWKITIC